MAEVRETKLPGVGVRFDFVTASGTPVGVLVHRSGRRDVLVYAEDDPSSCEATIQLDPGDATTLAELLGASRIAEELAAVQQDIAGLSIDWIVVEPDAEWAGKSLAGAAVHSTTQVSVVAIIGADGVAIAAPGADDVLAPGATAVAVGTPNGLGDLGAALATVVRVILGAASEDVAIAFVELGAILLGLAVLARASDRVGLSPIPAYLLAGLVFGEGGVATPVLSADFLELAGEIGVVLLLLTLGLEYTPEELVEGARLGWRGGVLDVVLNATPGVLAGILLGWSTEAIVLLGGITYISSSGVIAKLLADLGRLGNRETPAVLTILVLEDLAMAVYLPIVGVMLAGAAIIEGVSSVTIAMAVVALVIFAAMKFGPSLTRALHARSDEALLLGLLGATLLVAGVAQQLDISAAVGAFLVGIALSGPLQERATVLVAPLRDLFAAVFFVLFGFSIDPGALPSVLVPAVLLAIVTAITKVAVGWYASGKFGVSTRGRMRAGTALIARGEFSIVIAGLALGTSVEADLGALAGAYVLILAIAGPVLARFADQLAGLVPTRVQRAR